ncbi:MAG: hypothetical protein M1338_05815 [Patescibacteria group bacterium]|nr:hypothetical protein [Patescibacteria group bacterium]
MKTPEMGGLTPENKAEKFKMLFVYAFFKNDGAEGVHEELLTDVTKDEAIKHAKELWHDADEYKISDTQLSYPYGYLFEKDRSSEKISSALVGDVPPLDEIEQEIKRLDALNK